jgi:hypothetical protein
MIHKKTWQSSIELIDMKDANKRGKKAMRLSAWWNHDAREGTEAYDRQAAAFRLVAAMDERLPYQVAADALKAHLTTCQGNGDPVEWREREIKAIDCPLPKLEIRAEKWWGFADNDGVHLRDLTDRNNEPCEITRHDQAGTQAYRLAARVWDKVKQAETMFEASDILTKAGCKMHYYCAMD